MGEEWHLDIDNMGTFSLLFNHTRDGAIGVKKFGGKVIASKIKILKDFMIIVSILLYSFYQIFILFITKHYSMKKCVFTLIL